MEHIDRDVVPARAGVILRLSVLTVIDLCRSRASGGDPDTRGADPLHEMSFPRERG